MKEKIKFLFFVANLIGNKFFIFVKTKNDFSIFYFLRELFVKPFVSEKYDFAKKTATYLNVLLN